MVSLILVRHGESEKNRAYWAEFCFDVVLDLGRLLGGAALCGAPGGY